MSLFRLDASIRVDHSASRAIADIVETTWRAEQFDPEIVRRDVGLNPLASSAWALAVGASRTPEIERTEAQREAATLAATLATEVIDADALLFAVPLYNFGVSQHFKAWVDLAITDSRLATGGPQPLAGKPAVLVVARGGAYGPGTPRDGWDHASSWIRRILEDVWATDLRFVEAEFTLVGVNPALDPFTDLAASMRKTAEERAADYGRELSRVNAPDLGP